MTKEEQERAAEAGGQLDGSIETTRQSSFPISYKENKVVEQAEKQARKTEKQGATEDRHRDRTLGSMRSPSADRSGGVAGATLPVVEEDKEASSREASVQDEKAGSAPPSGVAHTDERDEQPPPTPPKDKPPASTEQLSSDKQLPSLPNFNRLSMGLHSAAPQAPG